MARTPETSTGPPAETEVKPEDPEVAKVVTQAKAKRLRLQPAPTRRAVELFYCYAREDEPLRGELDKHLKLLGREGLLRVCHDREILPGTDWEQVIDKRLHSADVILLLVSADFIASDYIWGRELKVAMERHEAGEARVIPVILRPVDWTGAPFGRLHALPQDGRPIDSWPSRDEAFADVARGIRRVVSELSM